MLLLPVLPCEPHKTSIDSSVCLSVRPSTRHSKSAFVLFSRRRPLRTVFDVSYTMSLFSFVPPSSHVFSCLFVCLFVTFLILMGYVMYGTHHVICSCGGIHLYHHQFLIISNHATYAPPCIPQHIHNHLMFV